MVSSFGASYGDEIVHEDGTRSSSAGGTNSFPALVVMDHDYVQLKRPFPYRVPLKGSKSDAVKLLNQKFKKYLNKTAIKKAKLKSRDQLDD